jgi:S-adenosylmethionine:tRNA ribosyltransferase-isomerase
VLDASWPFGERYEISEKTVEKIRQTRTRRGRVIAAGTSVMRALEGNVLRHGGFLNPGRGKTELLIGPGYRPKIVEGLLTGLHEVEESHYRLALSLLPAIYLRQVLETAERRGYESHEFGDLCLIL